MQEYYNGDLVYGMYSIEGALLYGQEYLNNISILEVLCRLFRSSYHANLKMVLIRRLEEIAPGKENRAEVRN